MEIELGIQNVSRPVNFTTTESADVVSQTIANAVKTGEIINLLDDHGRHVIIPAKALGYALIGSETKHAVGFGAL